MRPPRYIAWISGIGAAGLLLILGLWMSSAEWIHLATVRGGDHSPVARVGHGGGRVVMSCRVMTPRLSCMAKWKISGDVRPVDWQDTTARWFPAPHVELATLPGSVTRVFQIRLPHWLIAMGYVVLWAGALAWCLRREKKRVARELAVAAL